MIIVVSSTVGTREGAILTTQLSMEALLATVIVPGIVRGVVVQIATRILKRLLFSFLLDVIQSNRLVGGVSTISISTLPPPEQNREQGLQCTGFLSRKMYPFENNKPKTRTCQKSIGIWVTHPIGGTLTPTFRK
jgi:hypothetical protein